MAQHLAVKCVCCEVLLAITDIVETMSKPCSGALYSYRKEKETHEFIF